MGLATRATSADLENVGQCHISQRVHLSYFQTDFNQKFFMNYEASIGIVALMCAGPNFCTLDNCLLYMDAPRNQPLICSSLL